MWQNKYEADYRQSRLSSQGCDVPTQKGSLARNEDLRECAIKSMVGASGRQRVQPECFDSFRFPHPCKKLLSLFEETVEPIFKHVQRLWKQTLILRQTRDLLLPKLLSGKLDISELDIETREEDNAN